MMEEAGGVAGGEGSGRRRSRRRRRTYGGGEERGRAGGLGGEIRTEKLLLKVEGRVEEGGGRQI